MNHTIKLTIADIIIQIQSRFPLEQLTKEERRLQAAERFKNFFYAGNKKPDILIKIEIADKIPRINNAKPLFTTRHFQDGSANWKLLKKNNTYVYESLLKFKRQLILINRNFDSATAYFLPKKKKGKVWRIEDIIYDFLQVLLITYLAAKKKGIFTHAMGVKDLDGKGFLFAGKSGCGKTSTAELWHKHAKAMVLNDDRVIVRNNNGRFFIYGSPWHGAFSDYLVSKMESAPFEKLFFIHHSFKNIARQVSKKTAFNLLYPSMFPTFWDTKCLENIISFCQDLIRSVPCYSLGFVNNKNVIEFVRKIE